MLTVELKSRNSICSCAFFPPDAIDSNWVQRRWRPLWSSWGYKQTGMGWMLWGVWWWFDPLPASKSSSSWWGGGCVIFWYQYDCGSQNRMVPWAGAVSGWRCLWAPQPTVQQFLEHLSWYVVWARCFPDVNLPQGSLDISWDQAV